MDIRVNQIGGSRAVKEEEGLNWIKPAACRPVRPNGFGLTPSSVVLIGVSHANVVAYLKPTRQAVSDVA